jgi:DNA-binding CsgD family transcriptional regulator/PAS domain-containing protein
VAVPTRGGRVRRIRRCTASPHLASPRGKRSAGPKRDSRATGPDDTIRALTPLQPSIVDALLEQLPNGVVILNSSGRVIRTNVTIGAGRFIEFDRTRPYPEQLARFRPREARSNRSLNPDEMPSAQVMAGKTIARTEVLVWDADGQRDVWVQVRGRPVFDANGAVSGAVMIYKDVTAARTARQRRMAHPLVKALVEHGLPTSIESLSPREAEILRLLVRGMTNREIGRVLHLSPGTVRNYIGRLLDKLGATDRTHAAALAVTLTLLDEE